MSLAPRCRVAAWFFHWETKCWRLLIGFNPPVQTTDSSAFLLPHGFFTNTTHYVNPGWPLPVIDTTDRTPLLVVAAPQSDTGGLLAIWTLPAWDVYDTSAATCPATPPGAATETPFVLANLTRGRTWSRLDSGGLPVVVETTPSSVAGSGTFELMPGRGVPTGDYAQHTVVWNGQEVLLFGGARFTSDRWQYRNHLWRFEPINAMLYQPRVINYERTVLRNITEREVALLVECAPPSPPSKPAPPSPPSKPALQARPSSPPLQAHPSKPAPRSPPLHA